MRWGVDGTESWEGHAHFDWDSDELHRARTQGEMAHNMHRWAEMQIARGSWTAEEWHLATRVRAEEAQERGIREDAERAVLRAWCGLERHARAGQRGDASPRDNMVGWSTTDGRHGREGDWVPCRQLVFMGESDRFKGITVTSGKEPCSREQFSAKLKASLHKWIKEVRE